MGLTSATKQWLKSKSPLPSDQRPHQLPREPKKIIFRLLSVKETPSFRRRFLIYSNVVYPLAFWNHKRQINLIVSTHIAFFSSKRRHRCFSAALFLRGNIRVVLGCGSLNLDNRKRLTKARTTSSSQPRAPTKIPRENLPAESSSNTDKRSLSACDNSAMVNLPFWPKQ